MKKVFKYVVFSVGLLFLASTASAVGITNPLPGVATFGQLLLNIGKALGLLISSLATIMLIIAGIFYLTSAGSPERMGVAKKALIYAIVGMAIGIAATTITTMVVNILNGQAP